MKPDVVYPLVPKVYYLLAVDSNTISTGDMFNAENNICPNAKSRVL